MDKDKVLKLAQLARIGIDEKEAETLSGEFESILDYVSQVKKLTDQKNLSDSKIKENYPNRNKLREDDVNHESGVYTQEILKNAPEKDGEYFKVKKIIA